MFILLPRSGKHFCLQTQISKHPAKFWIIIISNDYPYILHDVIVEHNIKQVINQLKTK